MRVLVVEDNERVRDVIARALRAAGYTPSLAIDCRTAAQLLDDAELDLAIVDVGLPDGSGLELCQDARRRGHELPILMLTARAELQDRIRGLDAGADDYLGKPFSSEELTARIRALGRRGPRWVHAVKSFGLIEIDRDRRTVKRGGTLVPLTPREFDIVTLLAWRSGRVVPRDEILEIVWGSAEENTSSSLDVLVARIRRKLATEAIRTVRQTGYAWGLELSNPR